MLLSAALRVSKVYWVLNVFFYLSDFSLKGSAEMVVVLCACLRLIQPLLTVCKVTTHCETCSWRHHASLLAALLIPSHRHLIYRLFSVPAPPAAGEGGGWGSEGLAFDEIRHQLVQTACGKVTLLLRVSLISCSSRYLKEKQTNQKKTTKKTKRIWTWRLKLWAWCRRVS